MKTKIKRHCRSAVSVLLSVCILISCVAVGLIGTDAAQVDDDSMAGAPNDSTHHSVVYNHAGEGIVQFNSSGVATVTPTSTDTMYFHITRDDWGNDGEFNYYEDQTISANGTEYSLYQHKANNSDNNKTWPGLSVTSGTTYYFTLTQTGTEVKYTVTTLPCIKYGTSDTGQNSELALVKNASDSNLYESSAPLTISSGNLFFRPYINSSYPWDKGNQNDTSDVNVAFGAGTADLFGNTYGKQGNNRVPGNVFARIAPTAEGAGLPYNFSYNATTKTVTVTCAAAVTLNVDPISGATASVTVGSTIVNAGNSDTVTPGQRATITVTPADPNKKISKVYYNDTAVKMVSNRDGSYSGTFTVPNEATTVTFDQLTDKPSYKVKVAVNDPSYGTAEITSAGDGEYSESATYMEDTPIVLSATAAGTDHPFRAWDKGTDKTNASATYYVDGDDCDVGDPSTITITAVFKTNYYKANAKIFGDTDYVYQGVSARFFDYYYDKEIKDGWLNYTENEAKDDNRQPYTILNQALKTYAQANNVLVPLYFGNMYALNRDVYDGMYGATTPTDISGVTGGENSLDYHFYWAANNSNGIESLYGGGNQYNYGHALTGLSGKSLNSSGNITHVSDKDSRTADNEVEMKLFDKDWLTSRSGGNYAYTGPLATIIDSPFPFVKETIKRIYFENVGSYNKAYTWSSYNGKDYKHSGDWPGTDLLYDSEKGKHYINVSTLAEKLQLSNNGSSATTPIVIPSDKNCYDVGNNAWSNVADNTEAHYYSFDSKDGQDNAFFKGIRDGEASPRMCYYFDQNKVHDRAFNYGFFPFDGNLAGTPSPAQDYGFGMRMDIEFTLGANGKNELGQDQIFKFSGDDDLWVYIDGNLVLDLGGAHGRSKGEINFGYTNGVNSASATENNTTVTVNDPDAYQMYSAGQTADTNRTELPPVHYTDPYYHGVTRNQTASVDRTKQKHTMTIFYMERGKHESNLKIGFSFSPVSNEFVAEKDLNLNGVSADEDFKTAVEALAKEDQFTFSNTWSDTANGTFAAPAPDLKNTFTHNGTDTVKTTGGTEQIPDASTTFRAGDVDSFVDKFASGKYFKLTETAAATNKFNYDDVLVVTDKAQNDARVLPADAANGVYKFDTVKPNANPNVDPVLIKATHVNTLKTRSLTIKKEIDGATDATTTFPIQVKIKLNRSLPDSPENYVAYRLPYVKSDSTTSTLDEDGKVSLKQNETITIGGIPENAKVMIVEDVPSGYNYVRTNVVKTGDSSTVEVNDTNNATVFTIPAYDTTATIHNEKRHTVTINKILTDGNGNTVADTTTEFKVRVQISDTENGIYSDFDGTYTKSGSTYNFVNGYATLKAGEQIAVDVEYNKYFKVTEKTDDISWQYAFNGIYMNSDAVNAENKKDNGYSLQITGDTTFNIHNKINCQYIINYKYTPYLLLTDAPVNTLQSYTVTGTFTGDELSNLVTWNTDKLEFKSDATEARKNFLSGKAPFEDNFMQKLTWDSIMEDESGTPNTTVRYELQSGVKTLIVDMEAVTTTDRTVYVYFKFPYSVDDNLSADDGTAKLASGNYNQQSESTQYGKWVTLNGVYDNPDTAQFVTAPEYVMNGGTKEYFHHWNITSAVDNDSRNAGKQSSIYKKCYYKEFNMTMYHDCYVEPVFVASETPFSPSELSLADTNFGEAAINFIENSRNQWNNNGGTSPKNNNRQTEGDRIYSDFVLTFGYQDLALNGYVMVDGVKKYYQPGFVLEKVAEVGEETKTAQEYKDQYASTENSAFVEYYITGSGSAPVGYDSTKFLTKSSIKATQLDNKNQMKYSFSLPVRDDNDLAHDTKEYKNYVYRAYSYLKAPDGTLLKVSEPVYFTIYDMASVNNGTNYTGGGQS